MEHAPMVNQPIEAPDVERIVAIADPVVRNLWITQAYADFSSRLRTPIDDVNQTWCGFAVWASATAGQSIRGEELPRIISDLLGRSEYQACVDAVNDRYRLLRGLAVVPRLVDSHVVRAFDDVVAAVSESIAHGNTLVFAELAPLFVAFLELLEAGDLAAVTPADLDAALDRATTEPVDADLRTAFGCYLQAAAEPSRERQARAVLAGNVLAVAHEQRRLQPDIAAAVDAGLVSAEDVVTRLVPRWVPDVVVRLLTGPVRGPLEALVRGLWQDAATVLLMTLRVPGAELRLSHTLPDLADGRLFPADLADLGDCDEAAPYRRWDRTGGTGQHVGAHDWVELGQRMSFIVNLFRSRQQDPTLGAAPFADAQLDVMRRGEVPPPPLLPARHATTGDATPEPS